MSVINIGALLIKRSSCRLNCTCRHIICVCMFIHRVQQLEEENGEMKLNVCRLKSQTEKLDQVSAIHQME